MNKHPYGLLAQALGPDTGEGLAERIGRLGFSFVQLSLAKALSDFTLVPGALSEDRALAIAEAFTRHGVRIEALGYNFNPIHPDLNQRKRELGLFKEQLHHARSFGARMVVTESGWNEAPDRWEQLASSLGELAEEAARADVLCGIEPSGPAVLSNAERMLEMLEQLGSPHVGVVLDPAHLVDAGNLERQGDIFRQAIDLLGHRTVLVHVKDFVLEPGGHKRNVLMGEGILDLPLLLGMLRERLSQVPITIEGYIREEELPQQVAFLDGLWRG